MKVVQGNQKLKATIESSDRYYKQQQFDNYRKNYQQNFKKEDIISQIVKVKMKFLFPKREIKTKIKFMCIM